MRVATLAVLAVVLSAVAPGQYAKRPPTSKGPRALGLVEVAANGKAHLVPVAIMINGDFFDAGAYKAAPVPMALESGTVYEGFRSGNSQGLFVVDAAMERPGSWLGVGNWRTNEEITRQKEKEAEVKKPRVEEGPKPPVLRHADSPKPPAPASSPAPPPQSDDSDRPKLKKPQGEAAPVAAPAVAATASNSEPEAPDRPALRRGKPTATASDELPQVNSVSARKTAAAMAKEAPPVQTIPAISDAGGPDPRSYVYSIKPDEEDALKKKMLAIAAEEISARARQMAANAIGEAPVTPVRKNGKASPASAPTFDDVQFHVFDLSSNNEPVLVLTAKAKLQSAASLEYMIALVARQDIYADLHKALSVVTDNQHLDVQPRSEFIDAVDADGDGRGELLFRQVSDSGKAFVIYRVIGNQLWPLFQGTPQ